MRRQLKKVVEFSKRVSDNENVPKPFHNGARMLRNDMFDMSIKVPARLVKEVHFTKLDEVMNYPAGTIILVDMESLIANIEGDHTDVSLDEFEVMYPN